MEKNISGQNVEIWFKIRLLKNQSISRRTGVVKEEGQLKWGVINIYWISQKGSHRRPSWSHWCKTGVRLMWRRGEEMQTVSAEWSSNNFFAKREWHLRDVCLKRALFSKHFKSRSRKVRLELQPLIEVLNSVCTITSYKILLQLSVWGSICLRQKEWWQKAQKNWEEDHMVSIIGNFRRLTSNSSLQ